MSGVALFVLLGAAVGGAVSPNVPLEHWSYLVVDKLVGQGLVESSLLCTRPFSRLEMSRVVREATAKAGDRTDLSPILHGLLERLAEEFPPEADPRGSLGGGGRRSEIKAVEDLYVRYVYTQEPAVPQGMTVRPFDLKPFGLENQRGERFADGSNLRVGFATHGVVWDRFAYYVQPEFEESSTTDAGLEAAYGYGKVGLGEVEVLVGKDSMWWGPGRHGATIMSNHAKPLTMVKVSNAEPVRLPWVFGLLGPFKAVFFLTELEEARVIPEPKLTGLRVSSKPHSALEAGFSRVVMFGGRGQPKPGWGDYLGAFRPGSEQAETNQLAGFDVSLLIPTGRLLPVQSIRLYGDWAGEDEAGMLPSKWGQMYGIELNDVSKTGRTDLCVEYAQTYQNGRQDFFYSHSLYRSGYTYKGQLIGHHVGTDARDLFVRLRHYLTTDLVVGVHYGLMVADLSDKGLPRVADVGVEATWFGPRDTQVRAAYRYQRLRMDMAEDMTNHVLDLGIVHDF